jgi:serine/threonine-protein kinase
MSDRAADPERLAGRVADGLPVDWEDAIQSAPGERERRIVRHLRLVESLGKLYRGDEPPARSSDGAFEATATVEPAAGPSVPVPPIGTWAHLELREKLGEGGFGEVYRAWDRRLEREVALKLLKAEESRDRSVASQVVEEGRLLAKLRHPNVVTVFGAEVHDGRVGIWMEFIRGRSLEQLLREHGPFGAREATLIGIDLCRALAAVHGTHVVHGDIKAPNVMREEGGRILLMDFGAGLDVSARGPREGKTISGTPFYMAPELIRGEPATRLSDIYGLGVLLYRLVTGSYPVEAASWSELRAKHARGETRLLRDVRADLPESFVKVVERATASKSDGRFSTAGQLEQALTLALGVEPAPPLAPATDASSATLGKPARRSVVRFLIGLAVLAAAAGVGVFVVAPLARRAGSASTGGGPTSAPASDAQTPTTLGNADDTASLPAAGTYTVEAALYRVRANSTVRERLEPGALLTLRDRLTLELKASTPLHVYVIDQDEKGRSFALFPLPGLEPRNPLPAGTTHVLPGSRDGAQQSWLVDTPGGREHLLVMASPTRLIEFEAEMNNLARAGQSAVPIPETTIARLRGIGGLTEAPAASGSKPAERLFEMAKRIASRSEVAKGIWVRTIDLENPRPK